MSNNIIDSIQVSGTVYQIQGSGGGNPTVELTQEQYDALVSAGTVSPTTYYIITDAEAVDLSNYYTKSETSGATQISTALNAKQNTLVAGDNISISGNVISASGGGASYSAGTNISIANDTINCTLPISTSTGWKSIKSERASVSGDRNIAWGMNAFVGELGSSYTPDNAFAFGAYVNAYNSNEAAFGKYNSSVQNTHAGGESGTTIFSVGNGTSNNSRHNAFEIRQNGDIYISKDGSDIKLQDNLGGAASSAITSGDTNAVAGGAVYDRFDEVEQVTAAALNALNDNFGGLKLQQISQSDYDALVSGGTVDSSTLYIITNVVS